MVATMVSFRATLTHGNVAKERPLENRRRATEPTMDTIRSIFFVLPLLILNAGCEMGDINITTSEGYEAGGETSDSSGETDVPTSTTSITDDSTSIGLADTSAAVPTDSSSGSTVTGSEQCDIVIDDPLESDGEHLYSPCYMSDAFYCPTCATWCETVGLGACFGVLAAESCPSLNEGLEAQGLCDQNMLEFSEPFRCVCDL